MAVNVSALSLAEPTWPDVIIDLLAENGLAPNRLAVEITESIALRLTDANRRGLHALVKLGIEVHLDDFGTGYSSLALLRDLPVTALKLDRSFVHGVERDSDGLALVIGLAGLARGLGLRTIAEGIESPRQADIVAEAGWEIGQGYLFGAPSASFLEAVGGEGVR